MRTLHKVQRMSKSTFPHSFTAIFPFSFVSDATNFFIHSLNVCFKIKCLCWLLVFFNQVAFLFLVYANITFTHSQTGLRREPFWFLCRINSFQNQNTYECNFNLIINNSYLFNSNMRTGTYLDQTHAIM